MWAEIIFSFWGKMAFQSKCDCNPSVPLAIKTIKIAFKVSQMDLNVIEQSNVFHKTITTVLIPDRKSTHCLIFSNRSENVHVRGQQISIHSQISN